ncbi:vacuolar protein sorting-associated protein [Protomyces lactucae-debilis]|uniref:Probable vacuolar protein sorting-associated protein 16 homolog n=1 Tax=Protomyces lactucae-debilis TaxID=2754530 RepID=A0A1Y2FQ57_PROLT|nr:vacuolar protein sorting-associated protein [Protomyces lactucae-debilis]ORY86132.1 vacuolar protein sorting-associated protein [Protomyces lactucae-debilis]
MDKPSASWDALGERFYCRHDLYTLSWPEFDFEEVLYAAAPYGGAIALTRNDERVQRYRGQTFAKGAVQIYSCTGEKIRDIRWEGVSVAALGWTDDERLLIVAREGQVRHYDLLGNFSQFSLLGSGTGVQIRDCQFWSKGMVARTTENVFIKVDHYNDAHPQAFSGVQLGIEVTAHSWAIIAPSFSLSRQVECIVAAGNTLFTLDGSEQQSQNISHGPFTHIQVSPNGQFVALRSEDGKIWVTSADFQRTLTEFDASGDGKPETLAWCGNDALVMLVGTVLTVIGPAGDIVQYAYDAAVGLVTEVDGLRIFSQTLCEFLQKVPETTERIFAPGSDSAASILLDAIDQLDSGSSEADESIRLIQPYLADAVDDCVRAAGEAHEPRWQKHLLRAASFGKSFLELYNSDEFVDLCEMLRVNNAVAYTDVGIPLTLEQSIRLTPEGLLDRLLQRKHHHLASKICAHLKLSPDVVYVHWACLKLQSTVEDDASICHSIVDKLSQRKQISYEQIARTAFQGGRLSLATELLKHEPRAGAQVPLLLDLEEDEAAMRMAIRSGDPDLLEHVVFRMKAKHPLAVFFRMINNKPAAVAVLIEYAKRHDTQLLKDFYYQDDRKVEAALSVLAESVEETERQQQYNKARLAMKMLESAKEHGLEQRLLEDNVKLFQIQDSLAKDLGTSFEGMSPIDIIMRLLTTGSLSRAQKVATAFKVPEVTFVWLQLRTFITQREWEALERWLFRLKKCPIGYDKIAREIQQAGNKKLASKVVALLSNGRERVELWLELEDPVAAAREALRLKQTELFEQAKQSSSGRDLAEIEEMARRAVTK